MAAVSSHVTAIQRCKYTTSVDIQKCSTKAAVTHLESHATRAQWICSRAENSAIQKRPTASFHTEPRSGKVRKVELTSHSWTDCLAAELFLSSCFSGHCSSQLLKEQVAEYTSCFALAVPNHLNIYRCSGGGGRSLRSLRVGAQGRAIHRYPTHAVPVPNKPYVASLDVKQNERTMSKRGVVGTTQVKST